MFQLEEVFSVDDVLDGGDTQGEVKSADGTAFNYVKGLKAGKSVTLENLQG